MHPFERLRYVARSGSDEPSLVAIEAGESLAQLGRHPEALLTACRRLVEFHPDCGPLWWLCARVLTSVDPRREAQLCVSELEDDATPYHLAAALDEQFERVFANRVPLVAVLMPAGQCEDGISLSTVASVNAVGRRGWGYREQQREDSLFRWLDYRQDSDEIAKLLTGSVIVLIEATAAGPDGVLLAGGNPPLAVSALLRALERDGTPIWAVCGTGRTLPAGLFDEVRARSARPAVRTGEQGGGTPSDDGPARRDHSRGVTTFVPVDLLTAVVGPAGGLEEPAKALATTSCSAIDELVTRAR